MRATISCSSDGFTAESASSRMSTRGRATSARDERDPLALTAGQGEAAVTDVPVEATLELGDHLTDSGGVQRLEDHLVVDVFGRAHAKVLAQRGREQHRFLGDHAYRPAQLRRVRFFELEAVEERSAAIGDQEPRRDGRDRRLPRSGRAVDDDDRARWHADPEIVEHASLAEIDRDPARTRARRTARAVCDRR